MTRRDRMVQITRDLTEARVQTRAALVVLSTHLHRTTESRRRGTPRSERTTPSQEAPHE